MDNILNGLNQTLFPGHRVIRVNGWDEAENTQFCAKMYEEIMDAYVTDMGSLEGLKKL